MTLEVKRICNVPSASGKNYYWIVGFAIPPELRLGDIVSGEELKVCNFCLWKEPCKPRVPPRGQLTADDYTCCYAHVDVENSFYCRARIIYRSGRVADGALFDEAACNQPLPSGGRGFLVEAKASPADLPVEP